MQPRQGAAFSLAHLYVAFGVLAVLGFANCIVFQSLEAAAITSLGPFVALFEVASGRIQWDMIYWPLVYSVAAIFAIGISLQFVGRAKGWDSTTRLLIWGACWVAWCVSGDLAIFTLLS